ncbi:hypothetical protein [Cohnella sp.]|uniref:hypothetical protein n=1 Tax=Cohnella sp. TaxID=1883426 RepID=UPI00258106E4|nr:hypothetical protein [Cohnella sp.]
MNGKAQALPSQASAICAVKAASSSEAYGGLSNLFSSTGYAVAKHASAAPIMPISSSFAP